MTLSSAEWFEFSRYCLATPKNACLSCTQVQVQQQGGQLSLRSRYGRSPNKDQKVEIWEQEITVAGRRWDSLPKEHNISSCAVLECQDAALFNSLALTIVWRQDGAKAVRAQQSPYLECWTHFSVNPWQPTSYSLSLRFTSFTSYI